MWRSEMQALHEALQLVSSVFLIGMVMALVGMTAHIKPSATLLSRDGGNWNEGNHRPVSCASPANTFDQPLWFNLECGE